MNLTKFVTNICLPLSVVMNLLMVGFLAGQLLPDRWFPAPLRERPVAGPGPRVAPLQGVPGWGNQLDVAAGAAALREPDRQRVHRILNRHAPELRASVQELTAKRRAALALLQNPPQDISLLEDALQDVTAATAAAQKKGQDVFVEIAKDLDPGARQTFLNATGSARADRRPPPQRRNPPPRPPGF